MRQWMSCLLRNCQDLIQSTKSHWYLPVTVGEPSVAVESPNPKVPVAEAELSVWLAVGAAVVDAVMK
jgi:hypothetical protein